MRRQIYERPRSVSMLRPWPLLVWVPVLLTPDLLPRRDYCFGPSQLNNPAANRSLRIMSGRARGNGSSKPSRDVTHRSTNTPTTSSTLLGQSESDPGQLN